MIRSENQRSEALVVNALRTLPQNQLEPNNTEKLTNIEKINLLLHRVFST